MFGQCITPPDAGGGTDAGCGATNTQQNCGSCGNACAGACVAHSNGESGTYYDCNPVGTYSQTDAMGACTSAGKTGCASVMATCEGGVDHAVCGSCTLLSTAYCWIYSGPHAGHVSTTTFFGASCLLCPSTLGPAWN
jgi:hypothetical protein